MTDFAQHERKALCDLLDTLGPDAPTLCEGWTTADLAAHLVVRERRPVAAIGIVAAPLASHTEHVQRKLRDRLGYAKLVDTVRHGPPLVFRPFDEPMNTAEYFIHTEDVRRAGEGGAHVEERVLSEGLENSLWSRVKFGAKGLAKKVSGKVVLAAPGLPPIEVGSEGPAATITGPPGELLLFLSGRGAVAHVQFDGEPAEVAKLRAVNLGI